MSSLAKVVHKRVGGQVKRHGAGAAWCLEIEERGRGYVEARLLLTTIRTKDLELFWLFCGGSLGMCIIRTAGEENVNTG